MTEEKDENILEHLEALRTLLIKCLIALAIGLIPMFFTAPYFLDALIKVITAKNEITLNFFAPMEVFILELKAALLLDILICFPYIAKQIWYFLQPALYEHEQKLIKSIILSATLLFIIGIIFCLFIIMPLVMRFAMSFATSTVQPMLGINNVITLALRLSFIFGLMFQFPLVTRALICTGITTYQSIKNKRRYVFTSILIISALLTPPDIISQLMLTIPTYSLFEIGLWSAKSFKN